MPIEMPMSTCAPAGGAAGVTETLLTPSAARAAAGASSDSVASATTRAGARRGCSQGRIFRVLDLGPERVMSFLRDDGAPRSLPQWYSLIRAFGPLADRPVSRSRSRALAGDDGAGFAAAAPRPSYTGVIGLRLRGQRRARDSTSA